jgi:hypothetical protein
MAWVRPVILLVAQPLARAVATIIKAWAAAFTSRILQKVGRAVFVDTGVTSNYQSDMQEMSRGSTLAQNACRGISRESFPIVFG